MTTEKNPKGPKHVAGDYSDWHNSPSCVVDLVPKVGGVGVALYCRRCKVWADLEGSNRTITLAEAAKAKPESISPAVTP